jgi:flagellar FliL protein
MVVKPIIAELKPPASGDQAGAEGGDGSGAEGGADKAPQIGPVLELDEFTVNLKDPGGQRYLRATLSISVTAEDPKFEKLSGEALKKWEEEFHGEMSHYVPAIRDICITAMTKRNASELSTAMGKEALKEEIQKAVDGLFHGSHKVIRVNLENFIIQ